MEKSKQFREKLKQGYWGKLTSKSGLKQMILSLLFFLCLFGILVAALKPEKYNLNIGQRVTVEIRSPKEIEDRYITEKLREEAAAQVEILYKLESSVHLEVKKEIESFFKLLYSVKEDEELGILEKREKLSENDINISGQPITIALDAPTERLKYLENYIYDIIAQKMEHGIKIEDLQKEKNEIKDYFMTLTDFDEGLQDLAITLINATIRPNQFMDMEATEAKRQEARANVERVMIRKGDVILREGETVTYDRLNLMRELGLLTEYSRIDVMLYIGIALLAMVVEAVLIAYLRIFNRDMFEKPKHLMMIMIIFITVLIVSKASSIISIYLMPVAAAGMVLAILTDARFAFLVNLALTLLVAVITGNDISLIFMALVGGSVGIFSVVNTQQRGSIFLAGIMVSIAHLATVIGIGFINSHEVVSVLSNGFYGVLNGIFCAILTVGSLPLWESLFDVVTPLKLLELSNPNHPLLKKLLIEAPGTYHHSIIVGNLSEAAANAVGANSLLARTGAFYHDIGKTVRPYFFKENQLTSENPHDKLSPSLSSLIITSHVKDGLEMAKKHKLPAEITDFIDQHHGNTLVAYFYHKAKNSENGENIEEDSFRYKGKKPQIKETAIVMLADSVEAAVRSLSAPNKEKIEKMIEKIFKDKLEDGQLEECNLTLKELEQIKQAFINVILGIFHERIEYPDLDIKEAKGRKISESSH